ncbi:vacuolar protein sorting-associated protein 26B-B [Paramyrothecium foliicola]|nr:vacuolar protein sorting-associated protein 26B-B [Paramyrothecium foliicola]
MFFDRGNHYEFLSLNQELAAPGELQHPQTFDFNFKNVEKQYESYNGINVKLRYFVRVTVSRRMADVIREKDIWVYSYRIPPEMNSSIKMDVGIEDCLHIEFEYSKSKYHLKDVIVGRIYFLLVRLKIKHMELSIIRRETTGAAPNQYNESETLVRFEIMDGSPSRGETIPIRLFLGGFDLTPTFRDVNKKFSTRYYLSLVLIDEGMYNHLSLAVAQPSALLTSNQMQDVTSSSRKSFCTARHLTRYPTPEQELSRYLCHLRISWLRPSPKVSRWSNVYTSAECATAILFLLAYRSAFMGTAVGFGEDASRHGYGHCATLWHALGTICCYNLIINDHNPVNLTEILGLVTHTLEMCLQSFTLH